MFQMLMSLMISFSAGAFEGQPKEIVVMPNLASKMTMILADLKVTDLKQEKFNCSQNTCNVLATVDSDVLATVGDVQWRAKYARVNVGRDGQIQTPFQSNVITFEELETENRLTMAINDDVEYRTLCFGKVGNNGRNCTTYKVIDSH